MSVGWLVGRSVGWLVGRLVGWSVGWSVGLVSQSVQFSSVQFSSVQFSSVGWLVGWLVDIFFLFKVWDHTSKRLLPPPAGKKATRLPITKTQWPECNRHLPTLWSDFTDAQEGKIRIVLIPDMEVLGDDILDDSTLTLRVASARFEGQKHPKILAQIIRKSPFDPPVTINFSEDQLRDFVTLRPAISEAFDTQV